MSDEAGSKVPTVAAPKSVGELIAMALAMEREAAARYDELAHEMARHGNHELADLFDELGAEERKHEAYIGRWMGPGYEDRPPATFQWQSPEAIEQEAKEDAGGVYLMTPYRALQLAVHNEERAFAFFSQIAAEVEDQAIREKAEVLAKEELEHVVRLRLERRRAWRAESQSSAFGSARLGTRAVRSLPALLSRAGAIEHEAETRYRTLARAMAARKDDRTAELLDHLAAEQRTLLVTIDGHPHERRPQDAAVDQDARISAAMPHEALRLALADAEEAFDFYATIAEQSAEQDLMQEAQSFAERALRRLKLIRERLDEIEPLDEGAS